MKQSPAHVKADDLTWEAAGDGVKRKILGYDSGLMMVHVRFTAGAIGYVHKHPHRQVTFVEQGSFEVQIGQTKTILRKGDSFSVPPDVEHGVVALENGDLVDVFTPAREDFLATAKLK